MNNKNMNNMNFNPINSFNQIQPNFKNNQIIPFPNLQIQNNMWFNNNMFNPCNLNLKNNYLLQNMQNNLFQQTFFKLFFQQYILNFFLNQNKNINQNPFQSPFPNFQNGPEMQTQLIQNKSTIDDLLQILREPNIAAKNPVRIDPYFCRSRVIRAETPSRIPLNNQIDYR